MPDLVITRVQLDAIVSAAVDADVTEVERVRDIVYVANGIRIYYLNIRWQEAGATPPPPISIGQGWPPEQTYLLRMERAIAREDVNDVLTAQTNNPASVMVTPDRRGVVGWTLIDDFDFESAT